MDVCEGLAAVVLALAEGDHYFQIELRESDVRLSSFKAKGSQSETGIRRQADAKIPSLIQTHPGRQ